MSAHRAALSGVLGLATGLKMLPSLEPRLLNLEAPWELAEISDCYPARQDATIGLLSRLSIAA